MGKLRNYNCTKTGQLLLLLLNFHLGQYPPGVRKWMKAFVAFLSKMIIIRRRLQSLEFSIRPLPSNTDSPHCVSRSQNYITKDRAYDANRAIFAPLELLSSLMLSPYQWVSISPCSKQKSEAFHVKQDLQLSTTSSHTDGVVISTPNYIHCQLVPLCNEDKLFEMSSKFTFFMSSIGIHNMKHTLCLHPLDCMDSLDFKLSPELCDPILFVPKLLKPFALVDAKEIKISKVQSSNLQNVTVEEEAFLLKQYFQVPKCLAVGDIFSICKYSSQSFVVDQVNSDTHKGSTNGRQLFNVSSEKTTLFTTVHTVNDYHPCVQYDGEKLNFAGSENGVNSSEENNIISVYSEKICFWLRTAYINHKYKNLNANDYDDLTEMEWCSDNIIWPNVLLYGDIGGGKHSICQHVSEKMGMNLVCVNTVNIIGDTSAYTEAKLRGISEKMKSNAPCLLVVKNIHVSTFQNVSLAKHVN